MTPHVQITTQSNGKQAKIFAIPLLHRIKKESAEEYSEMQEAFELMGWATLPDEIKMEIYDDVRFMVKELKGLYSSCDPFIQKRRERIHFWVQSFIDKISTREAVIRELKIKAI